MPLDLPRATAAGGVAANLGLRGADAVYIALAQQLGVTLVTWDREQLTRGAAMVLTRTPEQML